MDNSSYRSQYIASDTAKVSEQSANAVMHFGGVSQRQRVKSERIWKMGIQKQNTSS